MSTSAIESAVSFLHENDDFLILCHMKPDGDTLGSAFALCNALRQLGKRAQVACSDDITPRYHFLSEGLSRPEIYFPPKFFITVDVADTALLGEKYAPMADQIGLAIDHHPSFKAFGEINLCDPTAAACGEIVYGLIRQLGAEITETIGTAIYTALSTDTGCFRYSNTTHNTLRIAADLMERGLQPYPLNYKLFIEKSRSRLAIESRVLSEARFFENARIVVGVITLAMIAELQVQEDDMDDIASILRGISGVEVAFLIKEADGFLKISCRSNAHVNSNEIAAHFGGGGHKRAAGMRMTCSIEDAVSQILPHISFAKS